MRLLSFVVATSMLLVGSSALAADGDEVDLPSEPINVPLTPVAIYVPDCLKDERKALLGFMGATERSIERATCVSLIAKVQEGLAKTGIQHIVITRGSSQDDPKSHFDKSKEDLIQANYRLVITYPFAMRTKEGGRLSSTVSIWSASLDRQLASYFYVWGPYPKDATDTWSAAIIKGIAKPECSPVLNRKKKVKRIECHGFQP